MDKMPKRAQRSRMPKPIRKVIKSISTSIKQSPTKNPKQVKKKVAKKEEKRVKNIIRKGYDIRNPKTGEKTGLKRQELMRKYL